MPANDILKIFSPYDRSLIKEIPYHGPIDLEHALQKASSLFDNRSEWLPAYRRIEILEKVQEIMKANMERLTLDAAREGGKPYMDSKVEILRAINGVKIAAEEISRIHGQQIPMGSTAASINRWAFTLREPIGVAASISAFNHPLNLIVHQTVTAFAAGCPVIIKPALTTPLSCLNLMEIYREAGVPEGWIQCLILDNQEAEMLACDRRINYLSFIGSAKVGWYLKSKVAPGTRVALEHGGAAPVLVEADAQFEEVVPALAKGGFYHAGQVCVSVQRIFAHESIARDLAEAIAKSGKNLKVGDPLSPNTEVGPLILPREVERVDEWVKEACASGAELLSGGNKISDTCYAPTVLWNPPQDCSVSREEIFGPVVCVYPYKNRQEAIKLANALPYHFQAAVFTQNLDAALDMVNQLNATAVMVNDHTAFRVDWMPFGGRDLSGEGLGGIPYSIKEMTREKMMVFKSKFLG